VLPHKLRTNQPPEAAQNNGSNFNYLNGAARGIRTPDPIITNDGVASAPVRIAAHPARIAFAGRRLRPPVGSLAQSICSLYVLGRRLRISIRNEPLWLIRSSSRKNPAKPKTSAPPSVLVTERSSRLRAICSTFSSQRMLCRPGSAGRRSCCDPKVFTAPARPRAETRPASSELFVRHYAPQNGFGSPPTATARGSSSVRKFSSIMSTAVK
jgi:hypothetical protein